MGDSNLEVQHVSLLYDGGRSGSVFLQSLLDNHENIITFPATMLIGGLSGTHFDNFYQGVKDKNIEEIAIEFTKVYHTAFDSRNDVTACRLDKLGDLQNESIKVDIEKFRNIFLKLFDGKVDVNYKSIFVNAHIAWAIAQGKKLSSKLIILHALHTPEDKMELYCLNFPDSKHLVCVRDPIPSHNSRFKHHINRSRIFEGKVDFFRTLSDLNYPLNMTRDLLFAFKTISKYAGFENVRAVRNEDLHLRPKETLLRLCNFLDIEFKAQLLESTFFGLKHWGDDTILPRNGFAKEGPAEFIIRESYFNRRDVSLVEDLINKRILHYGYSRLTSTRKISSRRLNRITRWETISLSSILNKDFCIVKLVIYSRILGSNFHKLFIKLISIFLDKSDAEIIVEWRKYVDMRVDLMKSYIAENKDNPEPKFGLI